MSGDARPILIESNSRPHLLLNNLSKSFMDLSLASSSMLWQGTDSLTKTLNDSACRFHFMVAVDDRLYICVRPLTSST